MKNTLILLLLASITFHSCTQSKVEYLEENRIDLTSDDFDFPQKDFKIIGFGAYHGSEKTEQAEHALLKSLTKNGTIKYYLPETDFSIGHYFNEYLKTGDTILLKDLVIQSGNRVPQERTIEVYNKWKALKKLNDQLPEKNKLVVVGIDFPINSKYVSKHILELINDSDKELEPVTKIAEMVALDTVNYELKNSTYSYKILKNLVIDYENNKSEYEKYITNKAVFQHIISNLKMPYKKDPEREKAMYDNYLALDSVYDFKNNRQFLRMGFSHIMKSREGKDGYPYFFTRLIEQNIFTKEQVLSIVGYLTESEVVWDELYDDEGNYSGFTIEGGYGIGDYEKEYFRGIQSLKDAKVSDITLFRLNLKHSPYSNRIPDLIEVVMQDEESNTENVKGMSATDFLDYAVLISNSKASTPVFEMK